MKTIYILGIVILFSCQNHQVDLKKETFYYQNNYATYNNSRGRLLELYSNFEEYAADRSEYPEILERFKYRLLVADSMVKELDEVVQDLEQIKLKLWKRAGYYLKQDKNRIKEKLYINHFEFDRITNNQAGSFLTSVPNEFTGLEQKMKRLRFRLIDFVNYDTRKFYPEYNFFFVDPKMNVFPDFKKANSILDSALKTLSPDDREVVKRFYLNFSYNNVFIDENYKGFLDQKTLAETINCLTLIQNQLVSATGDLLNLMISRIGCCASYQIDKIYVNVDGPEIVQQGDSVTLKVFYSFFNSYAKPKVEVKNVNSIQYLKDGITYVRFKAEKDQEIKGEITILNKSGIPKTNSWQKKIKVLAK